MKEGDLRLCQFQNRFLFLLCHELAHGLGPTKVRVGDREVPFETALRDLHSCLEEAKADMLGVRLLRHFCAKNILNDNDLRGAVAAEIVHYFNLWRKGYKEAHSLGHLLEYNWLKSRGAVRYDNASNKLDIDCERALDAMEELSTEFIKIQARGDYDNAKKFIEEWSVVPPEVPEVTVALADLPIATRPIYNV